MMSNVAQRDDVIQDIKDMKQFIKDQVGKFVIKDDFSHTFKQIDDALDDHQMAIVEGRKKRKDLEESISKLTKSNDQKVNEHVFRSEAKKIWENFSKYCGFEDLENYKSDISFSLKYCMETTKD